MNENLLNEVESPPLNDDSGISEVVQNEKQKKAARPKRSLIKLFLLILSLLLLIAVVLAGLYVFKSGQNPFNGILKQVTFEQESPVSKLETISLSEMQRIALVKPDIPSRPPHIKNDEGETPNLLSGITLISDDLEHQVPSVEDLEEDSSLDNSLTPENNSSTLPEPSQEPRITPENLTELHDKLITEIDLKDKEILVQINALEEAIKSIEGSISGLNKKLSLYAQRTSETDNELSNIKKFVSDVNAKVKKVTYLVKKQEKKILSKKIKQASPPELSSFAIWNGKNAVYVEYPKGKLTMLYEGDIVNSWLVQSINLAKKEAVFKKGSRTEVLSIGGKK